MKGPAGGYSKNAVVKPTASSPFFMKQGTVAAFDKNNTNKVESDSDIHTDESMELYK